MGDRWVVVSGRTFKRSGCWYAVLLAGKWVVASYKEALALLDPTKTVTLAPEPEPEPERRKLTFGEAVEAVCADPSLEFSATVGVRRLLLRWSDGGLKVVDGMAMAVGITPAMLAAEWEAVS